MSLNHHAADCPHREEAPTASALTSHVDFFCDCHKNAEPEILPDGTSIVWPAGWNDARAQAWRRNHDLPRPKAWLKQHLAAIGEVELVSEDPATIQKAFQARHNKGQQVTFVYWTDEDYEAVTGQVTSLREHERPVRFAVRPKEAV